MMIEKLFMAILSIMVCLNVASCYYNYKGKNYKTAMFNAMAFGVLLVVLVMDILT